MITVGDLDTPIIIQSPTFTANANYGGIQEVTWADAIGEITKVWAYLIYKGGAEKEEADQQVGEQKVDFYIRYDTYQDNLQPNWRIKYKVVGADDSYIYYYIEKIAHIDGRHKITRLTAVQKDSN